MEVAPIQGFQNIYGEDERCTMGLAAGDVLALLNVVNGACAPGILS